MPRLLDRNSIFLVLSHIHRSHHTQRLLARDKRTLPLGIITIENTQRRTPHTFRLPCNSTSTFYIPFPRRCRRSNVNTVLLDRRSGGQLRRLPRLFHLLSSIIRQRRRLCLPLCSRIMLMSERRIQGLALFGPFDGRGDH